LLLLLRQLHIGAAVQPAAGLTLLQPKPLLLLGLTHLLQPSCLVRLLLLLLHQQLQRALLLLLLLLLLL
jgi:hypothetical protein